MRTVLPLLLIFWTMLPGCLGLAGDKKPPIAARDRPVLQVIVKYKDPKFDPSTGDYLQRLSSDIGARVVHVRPMSGDAQVLRFESEGNASNLQRVLARFAARPEVEWVEEDRRIRHR